jgi:hypothetical protein
VTVKWRRRWTARGAAAVTVSVLLVMMQEVTRQMVMTGKNTLFLVTGVCVVKWRRILIKVVCLAAEFDVLCVFVVSRTTRCAYCPIIQ